MLISAIVAVAKHNVIGMDNQMPWYLPGDLAWFKRKTLGHPVIMGRNTFSSMGRALPKRTNIVVTRDPYFTADGVLVAHSMEEALGLAFDEGAEEAFILGGGKVFEDTIDLWDRVYLTEIELETPGDVFFPKLDPETWQETWSEAHGTDEKNKWPYVFRILERREAADSEE